MASDSKAREANTSSSMRIECHQDLRLFFHETLSRALASRSVEAPRETEHYLVGLLAMLGHDSEVLSRSLVELELEAQGADRAATRIEHLRALGDQALSVSTLFDGHLERHGISRAYVAGVGARAYRHAASLADSRQPTRAEIFSDLGARFSVYAEVLEQVRETTALGTKDDVLALYLRYQRTQSPALLQRLHAHGVFALTETRSDSDPPS